MHKIMFKINLMHENTYNIWNVLFLVWPGMKSLVTSYKLLNDITQYVFLKFVSCTNISYKISYFKWLREVIKAAQKLFNLPVTSINAHHKKTVQLKTFLWIFQHPNFVKKTQSDLMYQIVYILELYGGYLGCIMHFQFNCHWRIHNLIIKCC